MAGLFFLIFMLLSAQQVRYHKNNNILPPSEMMETTVSFCSPEQGGNCFPVPPPSDVRELDRQQEQDYLQQAFQQEEPLEAKYLLPDMIARDISFPQQPPSAEVMAEAERNRLTEEEYSSYEEELPHDVIDDFGLAEQAQDKGYTVHNNRRRVSEMNIAPFRKPLWGRDPVIAIVIDDMGDNVRRTRDISSLKAPLTASFLTYPPRLQQQIDQSLIAGHEIMIHVPMQPKSAINVSSDVLTVEMTPQEVRQNFQAMLKKFRDVKGINNHMGSRFTEDRLRMSEIMKVLNEHNLFFLDSKTTPASVGKSVASEYGVEYANRHVFLDNRNELNYILRQLAVTEEIARKNGYAIAIGHPKSQTYEALRQWLPTLETKQIKLVPLSKIVTALN